MRDSKIERARMFASKLPFHKGEQRVWAVITDKRGKILSEAGNNYRKSSPVMKKFGQQAGYPEKEFWHAECRAIHNLPYGSAPYKISVARVNRDGDLLPSNPCPVCRAAIRKINIEVVECKI